MYEFTYELTTDHWQAFNAAHAALNSKLANEYELTQNVIHKQEFGYEYDVDYNFDLLEDDGE